MFSLLLVVGKIPGAHAILLSYVAFACQLKIHSTDLAGRAALRIAMPDARRRRAPEKEPRVRRKPKVSHK